LIKHYMSASGLRRSRCQNDPAQLLHILKAVDAFAVMREVNALLGEK